MATLSDDVRKLFDDPNFATVTSLNPDGSPQSSVVWVKSEGSDILFSTAKGRRKHRNFERDARTSALVVDPENPYRYVEVRGTVVMVDDPRGDLIQELSHKYTGQPFVDQPGNERVIVRIVPDKVIVRA
ncbi:PPOX class probable F420-dependent enzyme [Sinosporangium album]|uniref:PPOX class probable F420-dependent enzyme n=1 Tax=Sinosporangium album TaxID=504805 RepID=A0A1G8K0F6_9ACTN|nr:PPOX class F420-dependent oxidoreductase [Sinosporangium album]SDI36837.1 PPOX class probable F420-dependent enzyme [Sinosporangium album]